jgi:hypothetical protein
MAHATGGLLMPTDAVSLPKAWPNHVRSAILQVVPLAHFAIICARGWTANAINPRARQASEIDRLGAQLAMLQEQTRIKDARMGAIRPQRRPHCSPTLCMAILELKAAQGWSLAQTAKVFLIEPDTVASWSKRLDESGPSALVQTPEPVNKFPDFVRYIVQRLKTLCPALGKVKLAQLASACRRPGSEPRPHWPSDSLCASPQVKVRGKPGANLQLAVDFHQGCKHLPIRHAEACGVVLSGSPAGGL